MHGLVFRVFAFSCLVVRTYLITLCVDALCL
jgi:hypothetical protein